MDIAPVTSTAAMAVAVRQLQAVTEAQMEVMQRLAEGQRQVAALLADQGIGRQVDVSA